MNEPNTDRYYDIPFYEEEDKIVGKCCICKTELYEGYEKVYIEEEDEYFCDSTCVFDWVKKNFTVVE